MLTKTNELTNRVEQALAALDFSAENARIADLEGEIATAERAIASAEARCTAISRTLIEARGPDARAVADALADGAEASEAANAGPSHDDLRRERESLRAGIGELHKRIARAHEGIADQQREAMAKAGRAVAPLAASIMGEVRAMADSLFNAFAALEAIAEATRSHGRERGEALQAVNGIAGPSGAVPWRREVPVPGDVLAALAGLADKGKALPARLITVARPH